MPLRGSAEALSLSDLIELIRRGGYTGTLRVTTKGQRRELQFRRGELSLAALGRVAYRLGDILVRSNVASREQVESAFREQRKTGRRLGEILASYGVVSEDSIRQAVQRQLEEEVFDMLLWDGAYFRFSRRDDQGRARKRTTLHPSAPDRDEVEEEPGDPTDSAPLEESGERAPDESGEGAAREGEGDGERSEGDEAAREGAGSGVRGGKQEDDPLARFDTRSLVIEAARRHDEWLRIQRLVPSVKIAYRLRHGSAALLGIELEELRVEEAAIQEIAALPDLRAEDLIGRARLTRFEALSVIAKLVEGRQLQRLSRNAIENGLRATLQAGDRDRALRYFETAIESPDFDHGRCRSVFWMFLGRAETGAVLPEPFNARPHGRRVPELFEALLASGHPFVMKVTDGDRQLEARGNARTIALLGDEIGRFAAVMRELVKRDVLGRREVDAIRKQVEEGMSLDAILVGSGMMATRDFIRALKDRIAGVIFDTHFWPAPYIEVRFGDDVALTDELPGQTVAAKARLGEDVVAVPNDEWIRDELIEDAQAWVALTERMPKPRQLLRQCVEGTRRLPHMDDPLTHFDGVRTVEEVRNEVRMPPRDFYEMVATAIERERLEPVPAAEIKARLKQAVTADNAQLARWIAVSALEGGIEPEAIAPLLRGLWLAGEEAAPSTESAVVEAPGLPKSPSDSARFMASFSGDMTPQQGSSSMDVIRGDASTVPIGEVLQVLNHRGRSGTLHVRVRGYRSLNVYLDRGELAVLVTDFPALSNLKPLLGASSEVIPLREEDLLPPRLAEFKTNMLDVLSRPDASYQFTRDLLPPEFKRKENPVARVIVRTKRVLAELAQRLAEWEDFLTVLPDDHAVLRWKSDEDRMRCGSRFEPGDLQVLLLVDGENALCDVVRISERPSVEVYRLISELVREGVVIVGEPQTAEERERKMLREVIPTDEAILKFVSTQARLRADLKCDLEFRPIIHMLDGFTTVGDVIKTTGRDPLVIYRLFAGLVRDGFVEVPEGGRADAPDEQSDSEWSPEALGL